MKETKFTCLGAGTYNFDVVLKREYPDGPAKQRKYTEHICVQELGGNCGNVICELSYFGWQTFPIAKFDTSKVSEYMLNDLKRFGADTRFVTQNPTDYITVFRIIHAQDAEGHSKMMFSSLRNDGSRGRFAPARKYIGAQNGEAKALVSQLDFVPDVYFFGSMQAGHRQIAEALQPKGSLVYFEVNENLEKPEMIKKSLSYVKCSDIIKFSREIVPEVPEDWLPLSENKLIIQTLDEEGVRFKLGKNDWVKVAPIVNNEFVDPQGAGDWFTSSFIHALGELDMLSLDKMTVEGVKKAVLMAEETASDSVSYIGAKTMIYEEDPRKVQPNDVEEDFLHFTAEGKKNIIHQGFDRLEEIPSKDYREYDIKTSHAYRSDFDCVCGVEQPISGDCNPLSNFYLCQIPFQGLVFNSVEQMYHYFKFSNDPKLQKEILQLTKSVDIMRLCHGKQGSEDHERTRWMYMTLAIEQKYLHCKEFRDVVRHSGDMPLVELQSKFDIHGATVRGDHERIGGKFLGHSVSDKYVGMNGVGRCMMAVRQKFQHVDVENGWQAPAFTSLDEWWLQSPVYEELLGNMGHEIFRTDGIIGALCGDIVGKPYEFSPTKKYNFKMFAAGSKFSDDSVLTLAHAQWLMGERTTQHLEECMTNLYQKYPNAGFGGSFKKWLKGDRSIESCGNGSAMRISPVGFVAKTLDEALDLAKLSAMTSHRHPEGVKGAQATAAVIFLARHGKSKAEIKKYIEETFGYDLNRSTDEIRPGYKFAEICQTSVPESIICWLEADSYEDCIRRAISLGGDADTMACIAGGMACATPGMEITQEMADRAISYLTPDLKQIFLDFDRYTSEE